MAIVAFAHGGGPGTGWYRIEQPARWLSDHGVECRVIHPRDAVDKGVFRGVTTFVLQRAHGVETQRAVSHLIDRGVRVVYEIDDDLWRLPEWNPARAEYTKDVLVRIENLMRQCTAVTVSTQAMADRVVDLGCGAVYVVPNGIPLDLIPPRAVRTRQGVRVGWWGTRTHQGDLSLIGGALQRLLRDRPDVTLVTMGDGLPGVWPAARFERYPAVHPVAFYGALVGLELDVVVAPLVDNEFNRAKSPVKALEAGAIKVALAASRVGPYREHLEHGVTALLANNQAEWEANLFALVDTPTLRTTLAATARQRIEATWSMDQTGPQWKTALA